LNHLDEPFEVNILWIGPYPALAKLTSPLKSQLSRYNDSTEVQLLESSSIQSLSIQLVKVQGRHERNISNFQRELTDQLDEVMEANVTFALRPVESGFLLRFNRTLTLGRIVLLWLFSQQEIPISFPFFSSGELGPVLVTLITNSQVLLVEQEMSFQFMNKVLDFFLFLSVCSETFVLFLVRFLDCSEYVLSVWYGDFILCVLLIFSIPRWKRRQSARVVILERRGANRRCR
jgi:hypothetical protein